MKTIKPLTLGILHRPYTLAGRHRFAIAALGFFRLGEDNPRFLAENLQWPRVLPQLPAMQPLDEVWPKAQGEVLLCGSAHAPGGAPVAAMDVRLACAGVDKTLRVTGDREWLYGLIPLFQIGQPQPFTEMPLTWERAFGGARHPANPVGCGYAPNPLTAFFGTNRGAMPNVAAPHAPVRGHLHRLAPQGYGPIDLRWAPRKHHVGSYKAHWLAHEAPGLAGDTGHDFFQRAPEDQRLSGFFAGGETYRIEGMHPELPRIEGTLPTLAARAFVQRQGQPLSALEAVPLCCDTVWFFPGERLGLMVWHGETAIDTAEGLDIATVIVGYEAAHDARSLAYYRDVLALRLDPETAAQHAFNESQIAASFTPAQATDRAARKALAQASEQAQRQAQLDELDAEFWREAGIAPPTDHQPPRAEEADFPTLSAEQVAESDFDLTEMVASAKALVDAAKTKAEAQQAELAAMPQVQPQAKEMRVQQQEAYARASLPAFDLLPPDAAQAQVDAEAEALSAALDNAIANGAPISPEQLAQARAGLAERAARERAARRAAPRPGVESLPPELARWLGELALQWLRGGASLAGRDLAGADLSGLDFSGADLREVMLEHANLSGTRLAGANLAGAVLSATRLDNADFTACRLAGANLCGSRGTATDFSGADLTGVMALEAAWPQARLIGCQLKDWVAPEIVLDGADLSGARLETALLLGAQASSSRWLGALLDKSVLLNAVLADADFSGAQLVRTTLLDASLPRSRWDGASWTSCPLGGKADWQGASLRGASASASSWRGAAMQGADLGASRLIGCDFGEADLRGADLAAGVFARSLFMQATLAGADARGADFYQALLRQSDCRGADFTEANLVQADFSSADIGDAIWARVRLEPNRSVA
ncbi:DUF2169 family type VI secretion system accessory protein [Chitinolyticbacter albus]|uniref:DUF2169 family type VI secretion system accessory protein n=1 Tax=Chitinolyticbacter albus TaxID=2961951 RepID=UPI00210B7570|nr:DUF2169 domain-containing protein [Chitinolyticbacter albus]